VIVVAEQKRALYFGVLRTTGHYLWLDEHSSTLSPESKVPGFPWEMWLLDGTLLKNREVPDIEDGRVHWTAGGTPLWIAFFWWDNSVDARPRSNSGFYVQGFSHHDRAAAFAYACEQWPSVVARQRFPLVLFEGSAAQVR